MAGGGDFILISNISNISPNASLVLGWNFANFGWNLILANLDWKKRGEETARQERAPKDRLVGRDHLLF